MNLLEIPMSQREHPSIYYWPLIDGASVLTVANTGISFAPGSLFAESSVAITCVNDHVHIDINESLINPLVINQDVSSTLSLVIKNGSHVHVVIQNNAKGKLNENGVSHEVTVKLEENAQAFLYYLPHSHKEIELKQVFSASVAKNAHLSLFEFGFFTEHSFNHKMAIELLEPGAEISFFGLDQLYNHAQKRSALEIFHRAQKTQSSQIFRGIYSGDSLGSFLGKVIVEKSASLSSAKQFYKAIIAGQQAKAHVMPQLEIYNHNIFASHGASIGELDKDALFYLCSRGLAFSEAKALLIKSLSNDILDHINEPSIKNTVQRSLFKSVANML